MLWGRGMDDWIDSTHKELVVWITHQPLGSRKKLLAYAHWHISLPRIYSDSLFSKGHILSRHTIKSLPCQSGFANEPKVHLCQRSNVLRQHVNLCVFLSLSFVLLFFTSLNCITRTPLEQLLALKSSYFELPPTCRNLLHCFWKADVFQRKYLSTWGFSDLWWLNWVQTSKKKLIYSRGFHEQSAPFGFQQIYLCTSY